MRRVIFQSLYNDPGMSSLKHALFYFGKVSIPKNEAKFVRYVLTVPEHAVDHVQALKDQGLVEFDQDQGDVGGLFELISSEGLRQGRTRSYEESEVTPLFDCLDLPRNDLAFSQPLAYGAGLLAACVLASVAREHGLPCVDNPVLFDLINLGLKGIFEEFISQHGFSPKEVQDLKAQYLGQHLITLYLPSFEFRSFDDVREARDKARNQLSALHGRVDELAGRLSSAPWDKSYLAEVDSLVNQHVEPEIAELRKATSFSLARVARVVATAGAVLKMQSMLPEALANALIGVSALDVVKNELERVKIARLTHAFSLLLRVDS